jgi:hypothetical protein
MPERPIKRRNKIGRACSAYEGGERLIQVYGGET